MIDMLPDLNIDFDDTKHVYSVRGIRLPSVTQIMRPMNMMLYSHIPDETLYVAAGRGTRAHEQISNYLRYGIDETDDDTEAYMTAFKAFEQDYSPVWIASEYMSYHRQLRYAGTIDLVGFITPNDERGVDVIDIKCTASYHAVMIETQLGAYSEAIASQGTQIRNLYGLQLLKDGKYRFKTVENGYKTFLHCLALYNAMASELKPK